MSDQSPIEPSVLLIMPRLVHYNYYRCSLTTVTEVVSIVVLNCQECIFFFAPGRPRSRGMMMISVRLGAFALFLGGAR